MSLVVTGRDVLLVERSVGIQRVHQLCLHAHRGHVVDPRLCRRRSDWLRARAVGSVEVGEDIGGLEPPDACVRVLQVRHLDDAGHFFERLALRRPPRHSDDLMRELEFGHPLADHAAERAPLEAPEGDRLRGGGREVRLRLPAFAAAEGRGKGDGRGRERPRGKLQRHDAVAVRLEEVADDIVALVGLEASVGVDEVRELRLAPPRHHVAAVPDAVLGAGVHDHVDVQHRDRLTHLPAERARLKLVELQGFLGPVRRKRLAELPERQIKGVLVALVELSAIARNEGGGRAEHGGDAGSHGVQDIDGRPAHSAFHRDPSHTMRHLAAPRDRRHTTAAQSSGGEDGGRRKAAHGASEARQQAEGCRKTLHLLKF
mmetsp:Transcript_60372/g.143028  ORF Transcript_60372/g.143028 Transcript_60372/m.143028 type:complete len:372 (-) Transcript_60372:2-1117(-)